jgi:hypothetical protein
MVRNRSNALYCWVEFLQESRRWRVRTRTRPFSPPVSPTTGRENDHRLHCLRRQQDVFPAWVEASVWADNTRSHSCRVAPALNTSHKQGGHEVCLHALKSMR